MPLTPVRAGRHRLCYTSPMDYDHDYKALFSHAEMVADLRERHDDIIWRIRWGKDWLYVYLLLDEGSYHDHELATLRNLTAALFRLENSRTPEDVQQILQALIIWLQSPEQSGLRRTFTIWLKRIFLPGRMPKVRFDEAQDLQEIQNMVLGPVNTN